jgi:hypothetical protein
MLVLLLATDMSSLRDFVVVVNTFSATDMSSLRDFVVVVNAFSATDMSSLRDFVVVVNAFSAACYRHVIPTGPQGRHFIMGLSQKWDSLFFFIYIVTF